MIASLYVYRCNIVATILWIRTFCRDDALMEGYLRLIAFVIKSRNDTRNGINFD